MPRPIDADVVRPRLHAERVQQPVVVVRDSRRACGRRRRACRCLRRDRGCRSRTSPRRRRSSRSGSISSMIGVGAVAADAVGVEQADAEDEVVGRLRARGPSGGSTSDRRSETRTTAARRDRASATSVISTSRDPQRPSVAWNMFDVGSAGCSRRSGARRRRPARPARCGSRPRPPCAVVVASSCLLALLDRRSGRRRRRASGSPCAMRAGPRRATAPRRRSARPGSSECVTSRIVLPRRRNSANLSRHLCVKPSSPTASTSSTSSTSGST